MSVDSRVLTASRDVCWTARDAYYACVDQQQQQQLEQLQQTNNSEFDRRATAAACREQRARLEAACLPSWIRHFEQRREFERTKRLRMAALDAHYSRDAAAAKANESNSNSSGDNNKKSR